jgi:uncharacterized 2Fe-2S/4Fe-4S cluster protein (DUF4445 family)
MPDRLDEGLQMSGERHTVVFQPTGVRTEVESGERLRAAALAAGVEIRSLCGERINCGKCRVVLQSGNYERLGIRSSLENASPMLPGEEAYWNSRRKGLAAQGYDPDTVRLSCQIRVRGDLVVMVPESSRAVQQVVRKTARSRPVAVLPNVRKLYVELTPATLQDPRGDWERLKTALAETEALTRNSREIPLEQEQLEIDLPALRALQAAVRREEWALTVTVWGGREVVRVEPGYADTLLGLAVDIGTTTIAAHLCDLQDGSILATADMMNPQVAYGEDIMSRISYSLEEEAGAELLRRAAIQAVDQLAQRAARQAGFKAEEIVELVVVGNSAMHHFFMGLDARALGQAPYVPAIQHSLDLRARDLGLTAVHPGGHVHLLPLIASFVGADCMAVLLAEAPHEQEENWLIVDVGTNAELVLGNRERLVCTSTPTGPAFEGAHIEHGIRATEGAIERVEIDPQTGRSRYRVIGSGAWSDSADGERILARGICGSGIIDAVAGLYRAGLVQGDGLFTDQDCPGIRRSDESVEYILVEAGKTASGTEITITQEDIRQLQLAKAPLYVAAHYLLKSLGLERPERILLAGGFGTHIDPLKAMIVGMIPDCPLDRVHPVGNSAGDGAVIALLNREKRAEAGRLSETIQRVELPAQPGFQDQFFLALHFPHMLDPYPSLKDLAPPREPDPIAREWFGERVPGWESPPSKEIPTPDEHGKEGL